MLARTIGAAAIIFAGAAAAVHSQTPEDAIKARQEIMSFVGSQMRPLAGMTRGSAEFDADRARLMGGALGAMAASFPFLFVEGSETGLNTKAGPAVFEDLDGFASQSKMLLDAANAVEAAANAEQFAEAFGKLSGTCRSCHSKYRLN